MSKAGGEVSGAPSAKDTPARQSWEKGYFLRSFAAPLFFLASPFLWSVRPSDFLLLSPLTAPAASFARPLALSIAPSALSRELLLAPDGGVSKKLGPRALEGYEMMNSKDRKEAIYVLQAQESY